MGRRLKHTVRQQLAGAVLEFIEWELEPRRFRHEERQQLAAAVLEFIEWELEPSEKERLVQEMIGDLDNRMQRSRTPKVLLTCEVTKLRGAAMDRMKNQIVANKADNCDGSIRTSFKRIEEKRQYGGRRPQNY